jgi:hypothetical protein
VSDETKPPTDAQVREWLRMAEEATAPPWGVSSLNVHRSGFQAYVRTPAGVVNFDTPDRLATFIAAARTAVPALAAEVLRLRALLDGRASDAGKGTT